VAHPFAAMPSLRQFVDDALQRGCRECTVVSPRGPARARYLAGPDGAVASLPSMDDDELLTPSRLTYLVRWLKVDSYDHCVIDAPELDPRTAP
jgi:Mrp family chromosome partitioning ATPase